MPDGATRAGAQAVRQTAPPAVLPPPEHEADDTHSGELRVLYLSAGRPRRADSRACLELQANG
eukprot:2615904-Alexandrium_andersonii.AAC.1